MYVYHLQTPVLTDLERWSILSAYEKEAACKIIGIFNYLNVYESYSSPLLDQLTEIFWISNCYGLVG